MSFKVAARTILELGAELISSDAIALYELVKNAIDAGSDTGVDIEFVVAMTYRTYREFEEAWDIEESSIETWRDKILDKLESDAPASCKEEIAKRLEVAAQWDEIWEVIEYAYSELSFIKISDTGSGMSLADLGDAFLTIGTPRRALVIEDAIAKHEEDPTSKPPQTPLGEKGVGRLSAMRLGDTLSVRTTTEGGSFWNELNIDWNDFRKSLGAMLEDIPVAPEKAERKKKPSEHGTVLTIGRLNTTWAESVLEKLAADSLARLSDPFDANRPRFQIRISYNGKSVKYRRYIRKVLFKESHATVKGQYKANGPKGPELKLTISAPLYNREAFTESFYEIDLLAISKKLKSNVFAPAALRRLDNFRFDLYWFNRGRLRKPDGFDSVKEFRELLDRWLGIMLYRDGYQVLPYGNRGDDWLELDAQALRQKGFKLNTIQFVGRVAISRVENPYLVDQTNREGLRDCDEKEALLRILRFSIWTQLYNFLEEGKRAQSQPSDSKKDNPKLRIKKFLEYRQRAERKISRVQPARSEDRQLLREVTETLGNLEMMYKDAEGRIEAGTYERERLIDLAGVGLMIESLAHELTRTVEHSAAMLDDSEHEELSPSARAFFRSLKSSLTSIEKRLKILDPLSVSARQRRKNLDLRRIVDEVILSHEAQFERHNIGVKVVPAKVEPVDLFGVEGRVIQILENLISNSVYWLRMQKELKPSATSSITVEVVDSPTPGFRFSDSGPGIPVSRRERVFEPFYSTKEERARQGLGLFIARETAEFHGGSMYLDDEAVNPSGNLSTFVVELPDDRKKRGKR